MENFILKPQKDTEKVCERLLLLILNVKVLEREHDFRTTVCLTRNPAVEIQDKNTVPALNIL